MAKKKYRRNEIEPKVNLYSSKLQDLREVCEFLEANPDTPPGLMPKHLRYMVAGLLCALDWGDYWNLLSSRIPGGIQLNPDWRKIMAELEVNDPNKHAPERLVRVIQPIEAEQESLL
jgi:hypothetical protein